MITAILLGTLISYLLCYFLIVCTEVFKGKLESYAINKQVSTLSYVIYQWFVTTINNPTNMKTNMTL